MQHMQRGQKHTPSKGQHQKSGGSAGLQTQATSTHAFRATDFLHPHSYSMKVFVRDVASFTDMTITVSTTASVAQLKALVYSEKRNIHPEHQRLSFGNRVLEDGRSLPDYNISDESTILLQYGPKFPFTWRAPPESLVEDFELPGVSSGCQANVSTILGGSQSVNNNPFSPIRAYVPNCQLAYSTVKGVQGASVVGISIDGDTTGKGSLGQCSSLQSSDVAWEPMAHDREQWMEFDLLQQQDVAGIQTVGSVQSMKVLFRLSLQDEWRDYFLSESKPFTGSSVTFEVPVLARYVRICPMEWTQQIRMRGDVLVMPASYIHHTQCRVLQHASLAFSHIGPMLLIPQNFPKRDGSATTQLCVYHCSGSGLRPWIHPPVYLASQTTTLYVCVAPDQTIYVANSNCMYRVSLDGSLETLCGGASSASDGTGATAGFYNITGIVAGPSCMFLLDGHCVRSVTYSGVVTTIAGSYNAPGTTDGQGAAARFQTPRGICLDKSTGLIYLTETHRIRSIDANTETFFVSTVAGTSNSGFSEGVGTAATFSNPQGIAVCEGWLFVCDTGNHCVRKIAPDRRVSVALGCAQQAGYVDAKFGFHARLNSPSIICAGQHGELYVSNGTEDGGCIRRFTADICVSPYGNTYSGCSNIQGALHALSTSEDHRELCDWTILTDGSAVLACSALIKLRCPRLATEISALFADGQQLARLTGCSRRALQMLIDYVHSDSLSMPLETKEDVVSAVELLKLSDDYELPRLKVAIGRRLNRCINSENVCDLLMAAERHDANELRAACFQFAVFNFARVRCSAAFPSLPVSTIMDIVARISL